jgi:cytochrome c553
MKTILSILLALALLPLAAAAESARGGKYAGEERGKPLQPTTGNANWQKECGSCHIAYAPGLLPAESWRKVMLGLDQHFGADASLTAPEAAEITDFLVKGASNRWTASTSPLRITESQWFKGKHDAREVPAAVWARASIKSAANCQACHVDADKADFNEHSIKIPK